MDKNTIVGIVIGIIIAAVVVGAVMYFEGSSDNTTNTTNITNSTNSTPTNAVEKIVNNTSTDENAITDAAKISSVKVVENGQDGGYMVEITYTNGHFRQYNAETGKLIGSDLDQDDKYLNTGDFD